MKALSIKMAIILILILFMFIICISIKNKLHNNQSEHFNNKKYPPYQYPSGSFIQRYSS